MNRIHKRLACLNLALLLAALAALPAISVPAEAISAQAEIERPAGDEASAPLAAAARTTSSSLRLYRNSGSGDYFYKSAEPYYVSSYSPYRNYFRLRDYIFTRSGAAQVGWIELSSATSTDLIPLNATYSVPGGVTGSSLCAVWAPHNDGYVILNALFGEFSNPSVTNSLLNQQRVTYQKSGTPFPTDYLVSQRGYKLLGWTTEHTPSQETGGTLSGQWYSPGDDTPSGVSVLYAQEYSVTSSSLVIYHPGEGRVKRGGTILVQEGELPVILGEDSFIPPEGRVFQGWVSNPGETQPVYRPGDTAAPRGGIPIHLYAVWAKNETQVAPGLYASLDRGGRTFQLRAEAAYFTGNGYYGPPRAVLALYRDGRPLSTAVSQPQYAADVTLTAPYTGGAPTECKFFVTGGSGFQPLGPAVSIDPALIS